ncbi:MAG: pyridoxamine 5'-phosphate oxidase family protein, partial [Minisyncoccia bacterium]
STTSTLTAHGKKAKETAIQEFMMPLTEDGVKFLHAHHTAVLSSIDRGGNAHGAVVYYFVDANNVIYILTKSETNKAHNVLAHPQVAVTIFSSKNASTLQLQGQGSVESDSDVRDFIFHELGKPRKYDDVMDLPPVTKLDKGSFIVLRIRPTTGVFHDFSK